VLSAIPYSSNPTVLHTDESVLPSRDGAKASWNYLLPSCEPAPAAVRVSYDVTRLQRLDTDQTFLVTLNEQGEVAPETVIARMTYQHPIYTPASVAAQRRLPQLTTGRTAYAGAYHGWGFHEDGCRSGVRAAASLGVAFA
jgi:predicted NAD/FAD-binding protein